MQSSKQEGPSVEDEAGTNTPVGGEDEEEERGRNEKGDYLAVHYTFVGTFIFLWFSSH